MGGLHVIPCHLQKWVEAFQERRIPNGSLDIDSFNFSKAKWSVSFPKAEEAVVLGPKLKVKRIYNQNENGRNMREKGFIWFRNNRLLGCGI
ncbi:5,10-methylene tetrahydromethanopterin reductase [Sesbania bispinosa]|nr:5,10-methylene tetrahydromethanopterin reductase [Sesbania bispinosa]